MHPADELVIRREHGYRGQFLRNLSSLHKTRDDQVFICQQRAQSLKNSQGMDKLHAYFGQIKETKYHRRDGGITALYTVDNYGTTLRQL